MRNSEHAKDRAWWQTTRTAWMGFLLAAGFLALGGFVVANANGSHEAQLLRLSTGALFLLIGASHLLSAFAICRRRLGVSRTAAADHRHVPTAF
jgi:hypothetical protein